MKVIVRTDKAARIRAGLEPLDEVEVDIPVAECTEAQRNELASGESLVIGHHNDPVIIEPTVAAVLAALDARAATRQARAEQQAAEHEQLVQEWLARPVREWVRNVEADPAREFPVLGYNLPDDARLNERQKEAEALLAQVRALYTERQEERKKRREAAEAAYEAEQLAKKEALRAFALASPDPLLAARVREHAITPDVEWEKLARHVFADQVLKQIPALADLERSHTTPEGWTFIDSRERTTPTLAELLLLDAVRQQIAEQQVPATPHLAWMRYRDEDTGHSLCRAEMVISVTTPDKATVDRYVVLPTE